MLDHHAFGRAGGARRVDDVGQVLGARERGRIGHGLARQCRRRVVQANHDGAARRQRVAQCALRELWEETGIEANAIRIDPQFRYTLEYQVPWRDAGGQLRDKQLVVFLAELTKPAEIKLTEHLGYQWFEWNPPHRIQEQTIDGLLAAVERMS